MMTYNYMCDDEHMTLDVVKSSDHRKKYKKCQVCGKRSTRTFKANTQSSKTYNYASDAMSVHPEDVGQAIKAGLESGVRTEYTSEGQPIIRDRGHFKKHMKAHGFYERNAFC